MYIYTYMYIYKLSGGGGGLRRGARADSVQHRALPPRWTLRLPSQWLQRTGRARFGSGGARFKTRDLVKIRLRILTSVTRILPSLEERVGGARAEEVQRLAVCAKTQLFRENNVLFQKRLFRSKKAPFQTHNRFFRYHKNEKIVLLVPCRGNRIVRHGLVQPLLRLLYDSRA